VYDALDERGERELELSQVLTKRYAGIEQGLQRGGAVFRFPAPPAPPANEGIQNGPAAAPAAASGQVLAALDVQRAASLCVIFSTGCHHACSITSENARSLTTRSHCLQHLLAFHKASNVDRGQSSDGYSTALMGFLNMNALLSRRVWWAWMRTRCAWRRTSCCTWPAPAARRACRARRRAAGRPGPRPSAPPPPAAGRLAPTRRPATTPQVLSLLCLLQLRTSHLCLLQLRTSHMCPLSSHRKASRDVNHTNELGGAGAQH